MYQQLEPLKGRRDYLESSGKIPSFKTAAVGGRCPWWPGQVSVQLSQTLLFFPL